MADQVPSPGGPDWDGLLYLFIIAAFGWFGDWLRSRYQGRRPPTHEHRRHDDPPCEECHHHHRDDDDEELT